MHLLCKYLEYKLNQSWYNNEILLYMSKNSFFDEWCLYLLLYKLIVQFIYCWF